MKTQTYFKKKHHIEISEDEIPIICRLTCEDDLELQMRAGLNRLKELFDRFFDIDIAKKTKKRKYLDARELFIHYAAELGYTHVEIGETVNINHSTVSYWKAKHADDVKYNPLYRKKFKLIEQKLNAKQKITS